VAAFESAACASRVIAISRGDDVHDDDPRTLTAVAERRCEVFTDERVNGRGGQKARARARAGGRVR